MSINAESTYVEITGEAGLRLCFSLNDGKVKVSCFGFDIFMRDLLSIDDVRTLAKSLEIIADGAEKWRKEEAYKPVPPEVPILKISDTNEYEVLVLQERAIATAGTNVVAVRISYYYYNASKFVKQYTYNRNSPLGINPSPLLEYVPGDPGVCASFQLEGLNSNGDVVAYLAGNKEKGFHWVDKETGAGSGLWLFIKKQKIDVTKVPPPEISADEKIQALLRRQRPVMPRADGPQTVFNSAVAPSNPAKPMYEGDPSGVGTEAPIREIPNTNTTEPSGDALGLWQSINTNLDTLTTLVKRYLEGV